MAIGEATRAQRKASSLNKMLPNSKMAMVIAGAITAQKSVGRSSFEPAKQTSAPILAGAR